MDPTALNISLVGWFFGSVIFGVATMRGWYTASRRLEASTKRCAKLEARLGCPLEEEDLVPGAQYRREDPPDVFFVRRIRCSDSGSEPMRTIRACNLAEEDALPVNAIFSIIQSPDGQRRVFVETGIDLPRATIKTN